MIVSPARLALDAREEFELDAASPCIAEDATKLGEPVGCFCVAAVAPCRERLQAGLRHEPRPQPA
jgi:hypothetical protein